MARLFFTIMRNLFKQDILHIDIETYSEEDLPSTGSYKYAKHKDFEILLLAYSFNDEPTSIVDLSVLQDLPQRVKDAMLNPDITKAAHNASFERNCLAAYGINIPANQWICTAFLAAYCGLPRSLAKVASILQVTQKQETGKNLIKLFCEPTYKNGRKYRNSVYTHAKEWRMFKEYCKTDVDAEKDIFNALKVELTDFEMELFALDQQINDTGVAIDRTLALNALTFCEREKVFLIKRIREKYGIDNPSSNAQIKKFLSAKTGYNYTKLGAAELPALLNEYRDNAPVTEVLNAYSILSKKALTKYGTIINCATSDDRIRGLFVHYGANRTGRWTSQLVQLHNLKRNNIKHLDALREGVKKMDIPYLTSLPNVINDINQIIRTAFVAKKGHTFVIVDFSAIEARVLSWLAQENWRLDVFESHGKIYEATASKMFNVPLEEVDKDLRFKGKVAELALGYQGGANAMVRMAMGNPLSDAENKAIVKKWRATNKKIVAFWDDLNNACISAVQFGATTKVGFLEVGYNATIKNLYIKLPSGRCLMYHKPFLTTGMYGSVAVNYWNIDQDTKQWATVSTYGGKLTENVSQAVARDVLGFAMLNARDRGFEICMHVHDEFIAEVPYDIAEKELQRAIDIARLKPSWAETLPLNAEGFISKYYKKD